ncbi:20977_t:CDS:2 [Dentiscutata erythropus]|uniref:20977_t:CDS:1 n=1 Tax=Dentiscutata erythropus TaxID=1348616 RepID=A0A9N9ASN9_9GLOM|nr:20977_t:CDS:2 [Dentiscutata erythropus]
MSDEKIILIVGGIRYETLRSTFTAQPETLLGTMFRDQNEYIKNSVNGNEYFFDRNGEAFYYIMEFYRTGKLLWTTEIKEPQVTYQQLNEELDYFQINKSEIFSSLASKTAISTIGQFISSLEQLIISHYINNFDRGIYLEIRSDNNNIHCSNNLKSRFDQFKGCAFDILSNTKNQIKRYLVETFCELGLKWECLRKIYKYNNTSYQSFEINITFSSPVERLLKSESAQAHISFIQAPINTSEQKIILNVGGKKPTTLLGTMFQDRNKCMRHPINGNEYFFDRNSEAFYYILEFYRTGKLTLPTEFGNFTYKQLEEELDYFQIPFNRPTVICSSVLETIRNNINTLILAFEELIIRCCKYFINYIKLEFKGNKILTSIDGSDNSKRHYYDLPDLRNFCTSKFMYYETRVILDNMGKHIEDHLVKRFVDLGLKYESRQNYNSIHLITISFSFENVYKNFK